MRFRGRWRETLGIAEGIATLPHHERSDPDATLADLSAAPAGLSAALGIDGGSGAISGLDAADGWTALGSGRVTVYQGGAWRRYESGERFNF